MLKTEAKLFLNFPDPGGNLEKRNLHEGTVREVAGASISAEFKESLPELEPDTELLIFYEKRRKFVSQPARIEQVERRDHKVDVTLQTTGDPVPAEGRECFRASALAADLVADFGSEPGCTVLDVSATGFAVYATCSYDVSTQVEAALLFEGERLEGTVMVQSVQKIRRDRTRYGLSANDSVLAQSLPRLCLSIQRQMAARIHGTR